MTSPKQYGADLVGPTGNPIQIVSEKTTTMGCQRMAYPSTPDVARMPTNAEGIRQMLRDHDLMIYGLVRELVELRKKLGASE